MTPAIKKQIDNLFNQTIEPAFNEDFVFESELEAKEARQYLGELCSCIITDHVQIESEEDQDYNDSMDLESDLDD